jgi:AmmeMemoRadiSam system protein B
LRRDVGVIPINSENETVLYFTDPVSLCPNSLILPGAYNDLIPLFYAGFKLEDVLAQFPKSEQHQLENLLLRLTDLFDEYYLLENKHFKNKMEKIEASFEQNSVRPPTLAGSAYPDTEKEIRTGFDSIFKSILNRDQVISGGFSKGESTPYALYAPHIDIRVAPEVYGESFARIAHLKPDHVYIIGTSHYAGYYSQYDNSPIIFTEKDFQTPLGIIPNNRSKTRALFDSSGAGATVADRAHRMEHSIEIQLIFLQYLWSHEFTITPILIGSLDELLYSDLSNKFNTIDAFSKALHESKQENDLILISGDLSHIGKKFGDATTGIGMLDEVKAFDNETLDAASTGNSSELLSHIKSNLDAYRVCGYPPLFSFLKYLPEEITGNSFAYNYWDDSETESVVSYGSVLFGKKT